MNSRVEIRIIITGNNIDVKTSQASTSDGSVTGYPYRERRSSPPIEHCGGKRPPYYFPPIGGDGNGEGSDSETP